MLILLNVISAIIVLLYATHLGWISQSLQFRMQNDKNINEAYDRDLLLAIALVQAGQGRASFSSDGFIKISTQSHDFTIYGSDYRDEEFGVCYRYARDGYTQRVNGTLTFKTRQYLRDFKEEHLNVRDPSSLTKPLFNFKKEKVTIK